MLADLGILEHHALGVEVLSAEDADCLERGKIEHADVFFVSGLHGDEAFADADGHADFFEISVERGASLFGRKPRSLGCEHPR